VLTPEKANLRLRNFGLLRRSALDAGAALERGNLNGVRASWIRLAIGQGDPGISSRPRDEGSPLDRFWAAGSIPATILTLFALRILGIKGNASPPLITTALGIALVMTAVCVLSHRWLRLLTATQHAEPDPRWTATLTTFAGLLLGVFVTLSSVGAGALGVTCVIMLYPRLPTASIVGSDIAHAVPLTLVAGIGHWFLGSIDWHLLGFLLAGSLPGIVLGSHLAARVPDTVLRLGLATTLIIVASRLVL